MTKMYQLISVSGIPQGIINYIHALTMPSIGIRDLVEIVIISTIVYQVIKWIQLTRAWTLFKGIVVLLLFSLFAAVFELSTISWLLRNAFGIGIMAAVVIFQPELRRALEQLGRQNLFLGIISGDYSSPPTDEFDARTVQEIVRACYEMGAVKTGALIVIEQSVALGEYERTGIKIDGLVSSQLLINIFEHNTPLHDGAVIVRGGRIVSATCYLPLTDRLDLGKELGTRHRAAVGISEISDSVTIVVSEETGYISVAKEGRLQKNVDENELTKILEALLTEKNNGHNMDVLKKWKDRWKNGKTKN